MRKTALAFAALLLGIGARAQVVSAPRVRVAPVPVGAVGAALAHPVAPALAPSLSLPTAAVPRAALLAAPVLPAAPVAARAAAAHAAPPGPGPSQAAAAGPSAPRPIRVILMGPPGSGKTTYGKMMATEYGAVHISVGELLRAYAKDKPELAAQMQKGDLVDSALVLGLVRARLTQDDVKARGYILDGFPRRLEEAVAMEEWLGGVGVDAVVHLEVPQEELLRRIHARGRADDTDATFANRMRVYHEETLPVLERFRGSTGVLMPDVSGSTPEQNYARLRSILEDALKKR